MQWYLTIHMLVDLKKMVKIKRTLPRNVRLRTVLLVHVWFMVEKLQTYVWGKVSIEFLQKYVCNCKPNITLIVDSINIGKQEINSGRPLHCHHCPFLTGLLAWINLLYWRLSKSYTSEDALYDCFCQLFVVCMEKIDGTVTSKMDN